MAAHGYSILGCVPPTLTPTEQENRFVSLYDHTGRTLRFTSKDDVFRMIEDPMYRGLFNSYDEVEATRVQYPAVVELEVPWSIGLPQGDQQLPSSFQHALCIQLCPNLSRCSESPGLNEMRLCAFSNYCRLQVNDRDMRHRRASDGIEGLVPIFRGPRVKILLEKKDVETIEDGTRERQHWRYFQFCANCRAARAVRCCSHWADGVTIHPGERREVAKGELSDLDHHYGVPSGRAGKLYSESILSEDVINWAT